MQAEENALEAWVAIEEVEECQDVTLGTKAAAAVGSSPARVEHGNGASELYDLGASRHMSPYQEWFVTYHSIPPRAITTVDKCIFYAIGTGDLQIEVLNGSLTTAVLLKDTLHAPDMGVTIVSISRIAKAGYTVSFKGDSCKIKNCSGTIIGTIPATSNGLYKVDCAYVAAATAMLEHADMLTLHQCLGHIAPNTIRALIKSGAIEGIQLIDDGSALICDLCEHAKTTCKAVRKE